jgi:hypothetical protein
VRSRGGSLEGYECTSAAPPRRDRYIKGVDVGYHELCVAFGTPPSIFGLLLVEMQREGGKSTETPPQTPTEGVKEHQILSWGLRKDVADSFMQLGSRCLRANQSTAAMSSCLPFSSHLSGSS